MKIGAMKDKLSKSFTEADQVFIFGGDLKWDIKSTFSTLVPRPKIHNNLDTLINEIVSYTIPGDVVLIMSNGGFGGIHKRILAKLSD